MLDTLSSVWCPVSLVQAVGLCQVTGIGEYPLQQASGAIWALFLAMWPPSHVLWSSQRFHESPNILCKFLFCIKSRQSGFCCLQLETLIELEIGSRLFHFDSVQQTLIEYLPHGQTYFRQQ